MGDIGTSVVESRCLWRQYVTIRCGFFEERKRKNSGISFILVCVVCVFSDIFIDKVVWALLIFAIILLIGEDSIAGVF